MASPQSSHCSCRVDTNETDAQRRVQRIALALNAAIVPVGLFAGLIGHSGSELANSLHALADASVAGSAIQTRRKVQGRGRADEWRPAHSASVC